MSETNTAAGWPAFIFSVLALVSAYWAAPLVWGWYMVPLGLPALGWKTFFGAGSILYLVRGQTPTDKKGEELASAALTRLLSVWLTMAFAYGFRP